MKSCQHDGIFNQWHVIPWHSSGWHFDPWHVFQVTFHPVALSGGVLSRGILSGACCPVFFFKRHFIRISGQIATKFTKNAHIQETAKHSRYIFTALRFELFRFWLGCSWKPPPMIDWSATWVIASFIARLTAVAVLSSVASLLYVRGHNRSWAGRW